MGGLLISAVLLAQTPHLATTSQAAFVVDGKPELVRRHEDGTMTLSAGAIFRTRHLFSDFAISFEVRGVTRDAEAVVGIRSWPPESGDWPRRGYALKVTGRMAGELQGRRAKVRNIQFAPLRVGSERDWRHITVECIGELVSVGINRALLGSFVIEERTGLILFTVEKGVIEVRNIELRALPSIVTLSGISQARPEPQSAPGLTAPRVIEEVKPFYPPESKRSGVQGVVAIEVLVLRDGTVGSARVTRPLDPDCDQAALAAVQRWRFSPGKRDGKSVPAVVTVEMTFTLK